MSFWVNKRREGLGNENHMEEREEKVKEECKIDTKSIRAKDIRQNGKKDER